MIEISRTVQVNDDRIAPARSGPGVARAAAEGERRAAVRPPDGVLPRARARRRLARARHPPQGRAAAGAGDVRAEAPRRVRAHPRRRARPDRERDRDGRAGPPDPAVQLRAHPRGPRGGLRRGARALRPDAARVRERGGGHPRRRPAHRARTARRPGRRAREHPRRHACLDGRLLHGRRRARHGGHARPAHRRQHRTGRQQPAAARQGGDPGGRRAALGPPARDAAHLHPHVGGRRRRGRDRRRPGDLRAAERPVGHGAGDVDPHPARRAGQRPAVLHRHGAGLRRARPRARRAAAAH